jgi:hypothetical protein
MSITIAPVSQLQQDEFSAVVKRMKHTLSSRDLIKADGSLRVDRDELLVQAAKRSRDLAAHLVAIREFAEDFTTWADIPKNVRPLYIGNGKYRPQEGLIPISLMIKRLPPTIDAADVRSLFADYGAVRDVYIPYSYERDAPCNFAFIELMMEHTIPQYVYIGESRCNIEVALNGRRKPEEMKMRSV